MQELLKRYAEFVTHHAGMVLGILVVASGIIVSGTGRLVVDLDPEKHLPVDNRYVVVDRKIRQEFGGKNFVAIALVPRSGTIWQRDVLQTIRSLTLDLLNSSGVIRQNVVSLSSPYVRVPKQRGDVLTFDYLMKEVPKDEAEIAALRRLYQSEPLFQGMVASDDERAALILTDFYDSTSVDEIAATIDRAISRYRSSKIAIAVTGSPIFSHFEGKIVHQQGYYFIGTAAAILLVLYLAFGQIQGVILPSTTALLSTAWAMGFMGFAGIPLNPWTTAVPVVVMTVAAGHSAQMLKRYYEEFRRLGNRAAAVVESTRRIGVVMIAAGGTAGSGFAALSILRIPTLTQFGLGVASGIFSAVILEMTFMLALRVLWPTGRATGGEGPLSRCLENILRPIEAAASMYPRRVVASFIGIALVAGTGFPKLTTDFNTSTYWPERTQVGRDLRVFQKHFSNTTTITILLEGDPGSMKTPEAIQVMSGLQHAMADDPEVGRTFSIADIIRRTFEVFAPEEAANGLPADSRLIAQLFFLAQSPAFEGYVDRAYSRSVVRGLMNHENSGITSRVIMRLERYLERNRPQNIRVWLAGGAGPTLLALNEHAVTGKILNIVILLGVIFAIATVLLRTPLGGAYVIAPLFVALVINLGFFSWLRIPFDLSGASIAAVGVGIGADYAIYLLYRLREEFRRTGNIECALHRTMETSGRAILFVALAIGAGFSVYLMSDYYPLEICGFFMPVTMMVTSLTALTLLPALVVLVRPRFVFEPGNVDFTTARRPSLSLD